MRTTTLTPTPRLTRRQQAYLNRAIKLAEASTVRQKHGAVVVKGGSVMAVGVNSYTNDPQMFPTNYFSQNKIPHLQRSNKISIHAEVAAIRRLPAEQLKGATIYIARITQGGQIGFSAPCENCARELLKAGVKKIIYTE